MNVIRSFKYKYVCEKCGSTTDLIDTKIVQANALIRIGKREVTGGQSGKFKKVMIRKLLTEKTMRDDTIVNPEKELKKLNKCLDKTIKALKQYIKSPERFIGNPFLAERFNDVFTDHICPNCGHDQTWYPAIMEDQFPLKSAKANAIGFAIIGFLTTLCMALISNSFPLWYMYVIIGCSVFGALFGYIKTSSSKKRIDAHWNSATIHNKPDVDWDSMTVPIDDNNIDISEDDDDDIF